MSIANPFVLRSIATQHIENYGMKIKIRRYSNIERDELVSFENAEIQEWETWAIVSSKRQGITGIVSEVGDVPGGRLYVYVKYDEDVVIGDEVILPDDFPQESKEEATHYEFVVEAIDVKRMADIVIYKRLTVRPKLGVGV